MGLNIPPSDQNIQLSDIVTANATIARHGFLKKLSNVATEYMDGSGNFSTPVGGMASSGSAYEIIGGSAVATTNGTQLLSAYVTAQAATPQGAALATGNRYTIFLLPGVYDLGAGTLTLATEFIDIVGLSDDTGATWRSPAGESLTNEGDTVIKSTGPVVSITAAAPQDLTVENVCVKLTTAGASVAFGSPLGYGRNLKVVNVLIRETGGGTNPMTTNVGVSGTWIDVRHFDTGGLMFGASLGAAITVDGFFLRCKCVSGFGVPFSGALTVSGTFIDCEADGGSFGGGGSAATMSGTFIRCRYVLVTGSAGGMFGGTTGILSGTFIDCGAANAAWGATFTGLAIGCYGADPAGWNTTGNLSGKVIGCDFTTWKGVLPVNVADSATISNTVVETNFSINAPISPIAWKVGRAFRWEAWGKFSTDAVTPGTLTIRSKFGATVLRTTGARTLLGGATNAGWRASGVFVCRTLGGTVSTQLKLEIDSTGFIGDSITPSNGTVAINTAISNTFQLSAEWSVADTDNAITLENFIVIPEAGN